MKHRRLLMAIGLAAALTLGALAARWGARVEATGVISEQRWLMGTGWTITVDPAAGRTPQQVREAIAAAFAEVARVEAVMSEWKEDSPISAVNRGAGGPAIAVPQELSELVHRAVAIGERSAGAFDVTWKGMGKLWDFRVAPFAPPSAEAIDAARRRVDYRKVVFEGDRLGLAEAGMALGLGGIAKGYGVDRAAAILAAEGCTDFFVDGGGDVLVRGTKSGEPWKVGIRHPRREGELLAVIRSRGGAVVTSGDYERYRELDGVRYHHIIDPRTGEPARGCRSVTVVASQAELADALATAVFVLGPRDGLALIRSEPGAEVLIVDAAGEVLHTKGFPGEPLTR